MTAAARVPKNEQPPSVVAPDETPDPPVLEKDPITGLPMPPELAALMDEDHDDDDPDKDLPTLKELGTKLPIGYTDGEGNKHTDFSVRVYDWSIEEALGALAENEPNIPIGAYMSEVVGESIKSIGVYDFDKMNRAQRRLLLQNMYYSDVLYMYIHARIAAIGKIVKFKKFKNTCGHDVVFAGDIEFIKVQTMDSIPEKVIELEKGIVYGGAPRKKVRIGALKWRWIEVDDAGILANQSRLRVWMAQNGIVGFDDEGTPEGPVVLQDHQIKTAPPSEIAKLVNEINDINGGPIMEISGKCLECGKGKFRRTVDWRYDNFFGASSQ